MVCKRLTAHSGHSMGCDHTSALDPDLLCEILKRVPNIDRVRNVPLVNLRLSQACRDHALWADLHVQIFNFWTEVHWSSFLRWLVTRASEMQTLYIDNDKVEESEQGVEKLEEGGKDEELVEGHRAWAPQLQDLMAVLAVHALQLQSLVFRYSPFQDNASEVLSADFSLADLTPFCQLTSLYLELGQATVESAPLATALRGLPALEHLGLTLRCDWEECLVSVATSCPQLTSLIINGKHWGPSWDAPEEIGLLTNLVELTIDHLEVYRLPDSISKLTLLQCLRIYDGEGSVVELPSGLTACRQLSQLHITSDEASPVLADLKFLQQLEIAQCYGDVREMFWPRLTGLTALKLVLGYMTDPDEILEGFVGMTGLRKLHLVYAGTANLPKGPYLNALESICIQACNFYTGLPSNLAAATELRHIELAAFHKAYQRPDLFFGVLESLQALETIHMSDTTDFISLTWNDASRQYKSRCLAQGRSPVAITHSHDYY